MIHSDNRGGSRSTFKELRASAVHDSLCPDAPQRAFPPHNTTTKWDGDAAYDKERT